MFLSEGNDLKCCKSSINVVMYLQVFSQTQSGKKVWQLFALPPLPKHSYSRLHTANNHNYQSIQMIPFMQVETWCLIGTNSSFKWVSHQMFQRSTLLFEEHVRLVLPAQTTESLSLSLILWLWFICCGQAVFKEPGLQSLPSTPPSPPPPTPLPPVSKDVSHSHVCGVSFIPL